MGQQLRERQITDQVGRAALIVVLLAAVVVYLVTPFQAFNWLQLPFLGAFVEYPLSANLQVTRPFMGNGVAEMGGDLRQNDTILAVDGTPVGSARALSRELSRYRPGDTVTLSLRNDDGTAREIAVTLEAMPLQRFVPLFLVVYGTGLIYLAIGLWVYRRRRDQVVGRVFLLFCAVMAIVFATTFDLWTTHLFARLWMAAVPLAAGLLVALAIVFPSELPAAAHHPTLRWLPVLPALALAITQQALLGGASHAQVVTYWRWGYLFAGVALVTFLVMFLLRSILAYSPAVRDQSRVVLGGSLLSFAPFMLWAFQVFAAPEGWLVLAFLLFPLVIAYSIVQYNVIESTRLATFTATYGVMGILVVVGYALLVAGISMVTTAAAADIATNPALVGALAFLLVLVFQPLRSRIQQMLDRLFFRSRERYEERLTAFRHTLTMVSNLGDIVRLLKQQLRETLMPTHTYVFLRDPETGEFVAAGEGGRPDTDIRFEAQSGLVLALSTTRDVIFLELNKPLPPELIDEHARLAILRTPILVPLQGQERLAGFVAVGGKRSGQKFENEDLRFIQALAEQASLAVERAQVIGDLERRVRELDVLSQVSQAVNFTTDPDVLMELIFTQTGKLIDTTNFYIITHNEQMGTLSYAFFVEGMDRYSEREGETWRDNEGLAAEIVRTGRPIRTDDYVAECRRRGVTPRPERFYAWMGVPLNAGARTMGAMVVASYTPGVSFTDEQLKFFWSIADQAATALDKARLFRETETRARQLATLNAISSELSSTLDLENLLVRIVRSAVDMLNTEAGSLFLVDETTNDLIFRVVEGGAQDLVGTRVPAGKGIVGEAAETGLPVIVNDVLKDHRWFSDVDRETEFQTRSLLAIPLRVKDQTIGVIEVINKRDGTPFNEEDVSLLTTFAAQAAVAVDNARLYEATDAELAARVDELQNLLRIDRELNRTLKLEGVIQVTLNWALRITGASAGAIAMLNDEGTGVMILAASGYDPAFVERHQTEPIPIDHGIVGRVLRTGRPEFVADVSADPDFYPVAAEPSVSEIVVPILRASQVIGVLTLESHVPGQLTAQDFEFSQRLVEHAAVAIENARLLHKVEQANRDKTEFISFVAHELKNPMTSIKGYTDLLRSGGTGPVNPMQMQFLGTIRSNVDRMTRLVSDLSDVARIETGALRLEMLPTPVQGVVEETLRGLQSQIEEKSQRLVIEVPEGLPPISADHIRMVQVLTNLVSNAHKYTPEGGEIHVGAELIVERDEETGRERHMIHHWVKDTGIGMSEDELEMLFTKFFRTQRAKDMAQGTGLGLTITKNLVESHGGRIWVESVLGMGTTFHYTIPVAVPESEDVQAAD